MSDDRNPGHYFGTSSYSRREFLKLAGAAPLVLTQARQSHAATSLPFRPAAFDATHDSVLIWLKGDTARAVRVDYGSSPSSAQLTAGPTVSLNRETDYCATVSLTRLTPGNTYSYRIVGSDSEKPLSEPAQFKTAPLGAQPFSFAFSADMDDRYQPFKLFDVIDSKRPDFFLHLGDTIYADLPAKRPFAPSLAHYRSKHAANRKDAHLQNCFARCVTYATWDDHETEDDCHSLNPFMERALQAFKEYWPCKAVEPAALYRQFSWAGIDFFICDTRRFRTPQSSIDGPEKTMLGAGQKRWFKDVLKASKSPFKFVVTSVPFQGGGADTWGSYPTERTELSRFIRQEKIGGVVFLTGDYHLARDWSNPKTGLKEYMAGPIASFTHYQLYPDARPRYEKTGNFHYGDGYNFGHWRVDPAAGRAKIEFVGAGGESMFQTEITA